LELKEKKGRKETGDGEEVIHRDDEFKEGEDCEIVNEDWRSPDLVNQSEPTYGGSHMTMTSFLFLTYFMTSIFTLNY